MRRLAATALACLGMMGAVEALGQECTDGDLWCAELTVGHHNTSDQFGYRRQESIGHLEPPTFEHGGITYTIDRIQLSSSPTLTIDLDPEWTPPTGTTRADWAYTIDGNPFPLDEYDD